MGNKIQAQKKTTQRPRLWVVLAPLGSGSASASACVVQQHGRAGCGWEVPAFLVCSFWRPSPGGLGVCVRRRDVCVKCVCAAGGSAEKSRAETKHDRWEGRRARWPIWLAMARAYPPPPRRHLLLLALLFPLPSPRVFPLPRPTLCRDAHADCGERVGFLGPIGHATGGGGGDWPSSCFFLGLQNQRAAGRATELAEGGGGMLT